MPLYDITDHLSPIDSNIISRRLKSKWKRHLCCNTVQLSKSLQAVCLYPASAFVWEEKSDLRERNCYSECKWGTNIYIFQGWLHFQSLDVSLSFHPLTLSPILFHSSYLHSVTVFHPSLPQAYMSPLQSHPPPSSSWSHFPSSSVSPSPLRLIHRSTRSSSCLIHLTTD